MIHRTEHGVSRASRLLLWASITTVAGFLIWANWAELDTITRATGQVIVSSRNQVIQTPDGGVLESMLVREGDKVKRGQVLFRFDQTRAGAGHQESLAKAAALRAAVARLQAEVFGGEPRFKGLSGFPELQANQRALFNRRQAAIQEEVAALERSLALVKSELDMNLPLQKSGDVSRAEILKLQRQVADVQGQITNRRNKYFQDAQADLAKAQEELESVEQVLTQRREQLAYTEVRAPMDGVVRNVRLTTQGGVAKPGDEILQIVPMEDDLIVEAKVRPADIAFIKPGLPATVKFDAYDYSIYGSLRGTVSYISADTLNEETRAGDMPYYRVQVKTQDRNLSSRKNERIDIQPGMTATVEIKTGRQTVLRYLTKPITKTLDESLGER
ncbi:MAG: HlyD family type I secretion periplasmic adaptor subunit [Pseudomonadota bacterium]|nr:HlyD family type I secretion periplasmic adaptor subunit [Pseudomonadota bacterium]